jgi:RES domain-containing protein
MAESISLAILENLVHMSREDFPNGYVVVGAAIPSQVGILFEDDLRETHGNLPPNVLGDRWLESMQTPILQVRSGIVPSEFNDLLNPQHPDFPKIVAELPIPFRFDERLFR